MTNIHWKLDFSAKCSMLREFQSPQGNQANVVDKMPTSMGQDDADSRWTFMIWAWYSQIITWMWDHEGSRLFISQQSQRVAFELLMFCALGFKWPVMNVVQLLLINYGIKLPKVHFSYFWISVCTENSKPEKELFFEHVVCILGVQTAALICSHVSLEQLNAKVFSSVDFRHCHYNFILICILN